MGIKLSSSTFILPKEGRDIWRIEKCEHKVDFGKIEVSLVNADGLKHLERYTLYKGDPKRGEVNEGALRAFSWMARKALGLEDFAEGEIEPEDLVGKYVEAECSIDEMPSQKEPGKTVKFAHLGQWETADGFEREEKQPKQKEAAIKKKPSTRSSLLDELD